MELVAISYYSYSTCLYLQLPKYSSFMALTFPLLHSKSILSPKESDSSFMCTAILRRIYMHQYFIESDAIYKVVHHHSQPKMKC